MKAANGVHIDCLHIMLIDEIEESLFYITFTRHGPTRTIMLCICSMSQREVKWFQKTAAQREQMVCIYKSIYSIPYHSLFLF